MGPQKDRVVPENKKCHLCGTPYTVPVIQDKGEEDISKAGNVARTVIRSSCRWERHKYSLIANYFHLLLCPQYLQGYYHHPKLSHFFSFLSFFPH